MTVAKTRNKQLPQRRPGFQPGQSGNPAGRPKGSRNKASILAQEMLDGEVEILVRRCIDLVLAGDQVALRLCLERLLPPRKDVPIRLALPEITGPQDLISAMATLLAAVSQGEITPLEAQPLGQLLEALRRSIETNDLDARLEQLETHLRLEVPQ
ncbi:MAG: hypothetical protein KMY53_11600 [Desulfarculus sp.]|nr:hypothetical protein [Pseudomonadota bacterium]MBU4600089.1 hypothetical protein [Pseudomonadota bacterium]MBV1715667.1 hypothetical protein [Desulfarculus sp.]MBV1738801.1 hypothetical protein [Desulfarculus sp.]